MWAGLALEQPARLELGSLCPRLAPDLATAGTGVPAILIGVFVLCLTVAAGLRRVRNGAQQDEILCKRWSWIDQA